VTIENVLDGADYHGKFSRMALEELARPLVAKLNELVDEAVAAAGAVALCWRMFFVSYCPSGLQVLTCRRLRWWSWLAAARGCLS